tara:strand:+ start:1183 stop:3552 length:2370 start_codon:yes stop_codon:yes gene_type:complete
MIVKSLVSFNAGEFSPWLDARIDLDKYGSGCRRLENFILTPYGGCRRRPGTEFVSEVTTSSESARLIPFRFNVSTSYVLILNGGKMQIAKGGATPSLVKSGDTPVEVLDELGQSSIPWSESQLRQVAYAQINDVMYLVHPEVSPRKLVRSSETSWSLTEVDFDFPLYRDENKSDITVNPSGTTGNITLTASADLFSEDMVGSKMQIGHDRAATGWEVKISLHDDDATSPNLLLDSDYQLTTNGTWDGTVKLQKSPGVGAGSFTDVRSWVGANDRNIIYSGKEIDGIHEYRLFFDHSSDGANSPNAILEAVDRTLYGEVKITGYTSPTEVAATVIKPLASSDATKRWSEGAMSEKRGYPAAITFHENRLVLGGIPGDPHAIYGSVTNDYENFEKGTNDDESYLHRILSGEHNAIRWLVSERVLLVGTEAGEFVMSGTGAGGQESMLTPSNVKARRHSNFGSAAIQAVFINDSVLYAQRSARKIREYGYVFERDRYQAADMTLLGEHITGLGVQEMTFQVQRDSILWTIVTGGELVGMTYEKEQNVMGWHRHTTPGGEFESVACIYGANEEDEVWTIVKRTIEGTEKRYIERLRPDQYRAQQNKDKDNYWYLDCAKRVTAGATEPDLTQVTGLEHLEGQTVKVMVDGAERETKTVQSGRVSLAKGGRTALVGLAYTSRLEPMKLDTPQQNGASRTREGKIWRLGFLVWNSMGGHYGANADGEISSGDYDQIVYRQTDAPMDASPAIFDGEFEVDFDSDYAESVTVGILNDSVYPMAVLALFPKLKYYGDQD